MLARSALAALSACLLTACGPSAPASWTQPDPSLETVQEVMKTKVDAAADALWESVSTIDTAAGEEARHPRTDADWAELAAHARRLIDGAVLLQTPRPISAPGSDLDDAATPGARTAAQVQQDIAKDHARFSGDAKMLEAAGRKSLAAIEAKDLPGFFASTEALDAVCETCHEAFWYPHTAPAVFPSEDRLARTENRP